MITLREQATNILQNVPDDKMSYVIDILRSLDGILSGSRATPSAAVEAIEAWHGFKQYKGIISCEIDEKAELAKARDEKYADIN
jgi:hypothetical protein